MWSAAKATLFTAYKDPSALKLLDEPYKPVHAFHPLVQIDSAVGEETRV